MVNVLNVVETVGIFAEFIAMIYYTYIFWPVFKLLRQHRSEIPAMYGFSESKEKDEPILRIK